MIFGSHSGIQTAAGPVNPACPGGASSFTLDDNLTPVSDQPCQVRVITDSDDSCALMYNQAGSSWAACGTRKGYVNGLVYYLSAPQGAEVVATVTRCPLGSPGFNSGAATKTVLHNNAAGFQACRFFLF